MHVSPHRSTSENAAGACGGPALDPAFGREVLDGLRTAPRTLPAKLFYDAAGARLFEQICSLPEYYLTRSEVAILAAHAGDIAILAGAQATLVEYGSGAEMSMGT